MVEERASMSAHLASGSCSAGWAMGGAWRGRGPSRKVGERFIPMNRDGRRRAREHQPLECKTWASQRVCPSARARSSSGSRPKAHRGDSRGWNQRRPRARPGPGRDRNGHRDRRRHGERGDYPDQGRPARHRPGSQAQPHHDAQHAPESVVCGPVQRARRARRRGGPQPVLRWSCSTRWRGGRASISRPTTPRLLASYRLRRRSPRHSGFGVAARSVSGVAATTSPWSAERRRCRTSTPTQRGGS